MNRQGSSSERDDGGSMNTSPKWSEIAKALSDTDRKLSADDSSAPSRELQRSFRDSSSTILSTMRMALKDAPTSPKLASKESVGSVSSFLDSALSTVSDGYISYSDSIKGSSPEVDVAERADTPQRSAVSNIERFSAPVDESPAIPRRLSEPALPRNFDFDLPSLRRSYNTDIFVGSLGTTPRTSNLDIHDDGPDSDVEGMILEYHSIEEQEIEWDSDITKTDLEDERGDKRDKVAALIRSREGSPKPNTKDPSPQFPRRRGRRRNRRDPGPADSKPAASDILGSPAGRGRSPREWRDARAAKTAELRWSVDGRSRALSTDEQIQTPRRLDSRNAVHRTEQDQEKAADTPKVTNRTARERNQPSFASPPIRAIMKEGDKEETPTTARPTPSPLEETSSASVSLRDKVQSLDCPPPLE